MNINKIFLMRLILYRTNVPLGGKPLPLYAITLKINLKTDIYIVLSLYYPDSYSI